MSRLALLTGLVLTFALVPAASGQLSAKQKHPGAPTDLRAFVLRADEPVQGNHTYSEMPAFAWSIVDNAAQYQIQLADNRSFSDVSILYQKTGLQAPVASIQLQLPWMNGNPYALWVHVRAVVNGYTTPWSKPFGFNMGWQNVPQQEQAPPGLIRWTPVEGANEYEVWYTNLNRAFMTYTNVADEREYWSLHPSLARTVKWRVRAVRTTATTSLPSGIQITPYGPWSDPFTTLTTGSVATGKLHDGTAISDVSSTTRPHSLMPGFAWQGTDGVGPDAIGDQLWRVYVYSDRACINQVMVGSLTGSPAWAPRAAQPLAWPVDEKTLKIDEGGVVLKYGAESNVFGADLGAVVASEGASSAAAATTATASSSTASPNFSSAAGQVELPDSGWPNGRYWWTVVPVQIVPDPNSGDPANPTIDYDDAELPQDACKSGREWGFGLQSAPVTTTAAATPYVSGLAPGPRVIAAASRAPKFTSLPLITWEPALGATSYEVQLSRQRYPWNPISQQTSLVTSALLPLGAKTLGVWYYRVRGVNPNLPANAQKMTWSSPVEIKITGNQFKAVVK